MSPNARKAIQNVAVTLVVVGAGTGAGIAWKRYGALNPYDQIEKKKRPVDPSSAFVATGVTIKHYQKGKLVASTEADRLTMAEDRNALKLKGIRNGVAQTAKGPFKFDAGAGVLHPNLRTVDISGGVHIQGKDIDVTTAQANINANQGKLTMPKPLQGDIGGGRGRAESLVYVPNKEFAQLTKVVWQGEPPKGLGAPVGAQSKAWDMAAADATQKGRIYTYTEARAQNGDLIVIAPKVVQDAKNDVLTATGRATYRSAKADFVADKVVIYRKEKRAVLTGNVVMLVHPKRDWDKPLPKNDDAGVKPMEPAIPAELQKGSSGGDVSPEEKKRDEELRSGKTLRDYPMNLKAAEVTYWYGDGNRHAVAKGGEPTAYQKFEDGRWRVMNAVEARYDGEKDLLDLFSEGAKRQVKMKNSIGDTMDAVWLQLTTKEDATEDEEEMKSKSAIAHLIDRDGDNELAGPKKPAKPKAADPKKPPAAVPPAKTEPPVKTEPPTTPPPTKVEPPIVISGG